MCLATSSPGDGVVVHKHEAAERITRITSNSDGCKSTSERSLTWRGSVEELLGFRVEEIPTSESWWLTKIHPDDLFDVVNSLSRILAPAPDRPYASEARIWAHNYRLRHANGHFLLVSERSIVDRDEGGNVLSMTSTIFDAEKRRVERKAHREFLDSRNQFALISNNTPSGIWMMECSRVAECPIFRHQQSGTEATNESEVFVHKNGSFYGDYASGGAVIEFRDVTSQKRLEKERLAAIVQNEQQSARRLVVHTEEEERTVRNMIADLWKVLIKASENHKANMASFVSFVCHELRNPLQGIISSNEFLSETLEKLDALTNSINHNGQETDAAAKTNGYTNGTGGQSTTQPRAANDPTIEAMRGLITYARELVSNVATCASHQALITNNVLDLSRLDAGKVEPSYDIVDLRALSSEAVEMMASRARVKSINLRLANNDASPLYLKADSTLMSQVMLNLIGNAVKFTPENGNIVVDIHCEPPDDSGNIVFHGSVTDDGVGMNEEEQQRLFKRFSQANKRVAQTYKGSGLGLSISKEIVKVLGGDMTVKSTPGAGSTFGFFTMHDFPTKDELTAFLRSGNGVTAVATDLEKFEISTSETIAPPPRFGKICVAEDNPINLRHLAKNLEALGYETPVLCTNGKEALDSFTQPDSDIDAVIIDMSMPIMDGLEATRLMREHEKTQNPARKRIPIIALSGNAMKEQVQEAMTAGTSDYMIKPCKRAQLKMMLEHWERISNDGSVHTPLVLK
ncbi:hypothetical protein E4T47_04001 [Aureobasidium subglaciale]|nr:hypothetical protein E4T47_04001 [Aureobasidium subglaciale]